MEKFRVGHTPKLQTNLIMRKGRNDELLLAIGKGGEGGALPWAQSPGTPSCRA